MFSEIMAGGRRERVHLATFGPYHPLIDFYKNIHSATCTWNFPSDVNYNHRFPPGSEMRARTNPKGVEGVDSCTRLSVSLTQPL